VITASAPTSGDISGATNSSDALVLRGLSKSFGDVAAVREVDLTVRTGSFLGLVGPNGAGKSTLLSMAVGLLRPDAGGAWVQGANVWDARSADRAKELLGVQPQGLALPPRLTGPELLTYLGLLRKMPAGVVEQRAEELLSVLDLDHAQQTLIGDYSTGMAKKLSLAVALLHAPQVLVLDEPFEAIDPLSAAVIRAILEGFVTFGGTVVMSSHIMVLVEQLCDSVAVLDSGRVLRAGTLNSVRAGHSLEDAFTALIGVRTPPRGLSWFRS
jgi:ABC-2 type transport system ATP-binding protein